MDSAFGLTPQSLLSPISTNLSPLHPIPTMHRFLGLPMTPVRPSTSYIFPNVPLSSFKRTHNLPYHRLPVWLLSFLPPTLPHCPYPSSHINLTGIHLHPYYVTNSFTCISSCFLCPSLYIGQRAWLTSSQTIAEISDLATTPRSCATSALPVIRYNICLWSDCLCTGPLGLPPLSRTRTNLLSSLLCGTWAQLTPYQGFLIQFLAYLLQSTASPPLYLFPLAFFRFFSYLLHTCSISLVFWFVIIKNSPD